MGKFRKGLEDSQYLLSKKTKFILNSVRNPQAQGLVERHNRNLNDFLSEAYSHFNLNNEQGVEWNLALDLENFWVIENNRYHVVTKFAANTIIITQDKKILDQIYRPSFAWWYLVESQSEELSEYWA